MSVTLGDLARLFVGKVHERAGAAADPAIEWFHESCTGVGGDVSDEIPWCSSFVNRLASLLELPRSRSRLARSWLAVGEGILLSEAVAGGDDIVVLRRGVGPQPGPDNHSAPGHVTTFAGLDGPDHFLGIGGNQSDGVTIARFAVADVLGVRRLR